MVVVPAVQVGVCGGSASSDVSCMYQVENFSCGCASIVVVIGNVICICST